jgi:hypothetical protein
LIRTLRAHRTAWTEVALVDEPDARQSDIRWLGQAGDDEPDEFSHGANLAQFEETFLERVKLRREIGSQVHDYVIAERGAGDKVKMEGAL